MAIFRMERVGLDDAWAASGAISREIPQSKVFTICGLVLNQLVDLTTTTATWYNDAYERFLANLSLASGGETYFDFTDMRVAYHNSRFHLGPYAPPRPAAMADSATNGLTHMLTVLHFGVQPIVLDRRGRPTWNLTDLTAGIPVGTPQLVLGGTFGAAAAMGSNVTINATANSRLQVYAYGVQPEPGDPPAAYLPRAIPHWVTNTPTFGGTSSLFGSSIDVPTNDVLYDITHLLYNGSNDPRDDQVITSWRLRNSQSNREILSFGGYTDSVRHAKVAELFTQLLLGGAPFSDNNSTMVTPSVAKIAAGPGGASDEGIIYVPVYKFADMKPEINPIYGLNMIGLNTGDLKIDLGIADNTGTTHRLLYRKYKPL